MHTQAVQSVLTFRLDEQPFAVPLLLVQRVIRATALTSVPALPPLITGLLNDHGTWIPVLDLRSRFGFQVHPLRPADRFILLDLPGRRVALLAEGDTGIREVVAQELSFPESGTPVEEVTGLAPTEGGVILILNPLKLINQTDEALLEEAIQMVLSHQPNGL